ncbi:MAG: anti-anti-sigma factor [Chloroflexi bacterium RBG_16_54_11]|nr:MAG: anti-anti-sigma factor [Chloroflexi bacterium RBG_16_54_11]
MAFTVTSKMLANGAAELSLFGELDASVANEFKMAVEKAAADNAKQLILNMKDLEFMSSAGLRVLVFAKQKMGYDVDIYVIAAQGPVRDTIEMTGFHHSVIMQDAYSAL